MTAEEWEEIKRAFEAALHLSVADRPGYLAACGYSPIVQETVIELLKNHEDAASLQSWHSSAQEPVLREGDLIGDRFRVVRFMASGGVGEVYEVYDERLRLRMALKTLRTEFSGEEGAIERFRREILIARGVSHDNLCRVFDFIEQRNAALPEATAVPCFTMELIDGQSLADYLRTARPLLPQDALPLIRQIARGLEALHDNGIVHRDLKPSNIMLAKKRNGHTRAVVMDFGLAKPEDRHGDLFESEAGFRAGAPYFMAPELLRKERPSVASDIYALGLVIDEMVTLSRAFTAKSLQALYFAKLWEQPVPPGRRSKGLPAHWEKVILCCLDADPAMRFRSAGEVVQALEDSGRALPAPPPAKARSHRHLFSRRNVLVAAAAVPAAAGLAVASLSLKPIETSIDVFEIENQTGEKDFEYFCRGTTSELMRRLAQMEGVQIVPMHATRSNPPPHKPARFSLEGALQAYRGQTRLSVMLTDNQQGTLAWSQQFDRQRVGNPLELQSDIAQGTVAGLKQQVIFGGTPPTGSAAVPLLTRIRRSLALQVSPQPAIPPTQSNEALDLYMRGRHLMEEVSAESLIAAIDYLKRAIDADPKFALAYAALSDAHRALSDYRSDSGADLQLARANAEAAVRQDPSLAEAHASLAGVEQCAWNWELADWHFKEALRLKPGFAKARRWYAGFILQFGRFDEALEQARQSIERDPFDRAAPTSYGLYLLFAGRCQEAVSVMAAAVEGKDMPGTRHNLGQAYVRLAHLSSGAESAAWYAKAFAEAEHVAQIESRAHPASLEEGRPRLSDRMFALFHSIAGDVQSARPYFDRMIEDVRAGRISYLELTYIYAAQGQRPQALDLIQAGIARRDQGLMYLKVDPFFEPLHAEPRYKESVKAMRL